MASAMEINMKKYVVSVGLVLLFVVIGLSGCQEKTGENGAVNQFDSRFIGVWQNIETYSDIETWTFFLNSTVKTIIIQEFEGETLTTTSWFNCKVESDTLCISSLDDSPGSPSYYLECFGFVFSDDTNRLELSFNGMTFMIFSKIS